MIYWPGDICNNYEREISRGKGIEVNFSIKKSLTASRTNYSEFDNVLPLKKKINQFPLSEMRMA